MIPPYGLNTRFLSQSIKHHMKDKTGTPNEDFIQYDLDSNEIRVQIIKQKKLLKIKDFSMSVVYLNEADKVILYKLDKLPSKLRVWHKYSDNFIKVLYQKTPMITVTGSNELFQKIHFDMFYNYT
jgi:hypothetical protein